jgi:hypothetical protein
MDDRFNAGRDFIRREARLVERRLFAVCFEGADGAGVIDALRGYTNTDGGFGHGLEPDKRCPASLPIDVEVALQAMVAARASDPVLVGNACQYLSRVADQADCRGAVPPAFPVIEGYPRAAHWTEWTYQPGLNPTAGLVGLLWQLGADHPWLAEAAGYCWDQLESGNLPTDGHAISEVLTFLGHAPERDRADAMAAKVGGQLASASMFHLHPDDTSYGLSPLSLAPFADSRWRGLFSDDVIQAHLDRLERDQQPDGGWQVSWEPPSQAALLEWRGFITLAQLRTLVSYGRLDPGA